MNLRATLPQSRLLPLIIATALFMENLDSTVLSTALATIAREFGSSPIHLKLALTSYLLSLAIFIPTSGWMADRFGARTVFRLAIVVFSLGSIGCGLSNNLAELVAARIVQGMGGAMMTPVGRLIIFKTIPKHELVNAMAWLTMPALLGPICGPPLGGFITTYGSWRWIFWINIPIALLGLVLASRFVPNIREEERRPFDLTGFLLLSPGLTALLVGSTLAGLSLVTPAATLIIAGSGVVLIALYVWHALRIPSPLVELRLLRFRTFRAGVGGGFMFRIGVGATPFLLPLLFQLGFHMSAFASGMLTFATGIGALMMKTLAGPMLRRFGFRRILVVNAVISSALVAAPAFFTPATPVLVIIAVLVTAGFVRSLQFTSINTSSISDVPAPLMGRVTSFTSVVQEVAGSIGVSVAALGLELVMRLNGEHELSAATFPPVFLGIGVLAMLSTIAFMRMPADAGADMLAPAARTGPAASVTIPSPANPRVPL